MMPKSVDSIGVTPLAKISPLQSIAKIGNSAQQLAARSEDFAKAQLLNKGLNSFANILPTTQQSVEAKVSFAASLINHSLKQADSKGAKTQFISPTVLSQQPSSPDELAKDLKAAVSQTGLFYESHLSEFSEGNRTLNAIKAEPQNQLNPAIHTMLSQQLQLLETQRFFWHGEVWPQQIMDWQIHLSENTDGAHTEQYQPENQSVISSDLVLDLPTLGKVKAKIKLVNEQLSIDFLAEEAQTASKLKTQSMRLIEAIKSRGQQLNELTVNRDE